jgi:hypothetical protein
LETKFILIGQGRRHVTLCLLFILVAAFATTASAQLKGRSDQRVNLSPFPFHVSTYGTQEQLPQNQVAGIVKDPRTGQLVLSTANGIVEFNGYRFGPYRSSLMYRNFLFVKLLSSPQFDQLVGVALGGMTYLLDEEPVVLGSYSAIDFGDDYTVFMDFEGKITYRKNDWNDAKTIETGITSARFIQWQDEETFLTADLERTYSYSVVSSKRDVILEDAVLASTFDSITGLTYFISRTQFYVKNDRQIVPIDLPVDNITELRDVEAVDGVVLITSNTGMYIVVQGYVFRYKETDFLPTNILEKIYVDRENDIIFIGTSNKGVLKLSRKKIVNFYDVSDVFMGTFGSLVFGGGRLFAAAGVNVVNLRLQNEFRVLDFDFPRTPISSLSIFADTMYIGYWGNGLHALSLKDGSKVFYDKMDERSVFATMIDRKGNYWIALSDGIATGKSLQSLDKHLPDTIFDQMTTVYESRDGSLWFGGRSGIVVLDDTRDIKLTLGPDDGLEAIDVRAFFEDDQGKMWIGTYAGGLYVYDGGVLVSLRAKDNYLLGDDIFTLAPDLLGYVHVTSNNGLLIVHKDALEAFLNGKIDYLVPYYFGEEAGIFNTEFNGGFFNNHVSISGQYFYYPTIQGIVQYTASTIKNKPTKLQFNGVYLDDQITGMPSEIPREVQNIRVEFFDLNFTELYNVHYQYRLLGSQTRERWSKPQKSTAVSFYDLTPGEYTLEIRTINGSNDPNPQTISYVFSVKPYFYEMASFQVLMVFLFIVLIGLALQRRFTLKQIAMKRELEFSNTITELELNAIHAQMNPHLIFNSLNTLVHLIRSKSMEKAENFTVDFAQLLRNILEKSGEHFIEIGREIQMLNNYLQIQTIRYNDMFSYDIECDPTLLSERIPTMLIQPFVENAVIHGLAHKRSGGRLEIRFIRHIDAIVIEIEDDGVGRERANAINQGKKRKSMGMLLVQKKIELLRSKYELDFELDVMDSNDEQHTGTLVRIVIHRKDSGFGRMTSH